MLLLCDGCNSAFHLQCTKPRLRKVPAGTPSVYRVNLELPVVVEYIIGEHVILLHAACLLPHKLGNAFRSGATRCSEPSDGSTLLDNGGLRVGEQDC